jgi:hypothetical protein
MYLLMLRMNASDYSCGCRTTAPVFAPGSCCPLLRVVCVLECPTVWLLSVYYVCVCVLPLTISQLVCEGLHAGNIANTTSKLRGASVRIRVFNRDVRLRGVWKPDYWTAATAASKCDRSFCWMAVCLA